MASRFLRPSLLIATLTAFALPAAIALAGPGRGTKGPRRPAPKAQPSKGPANNDVKQMGTVPELNKAVYLGNRGHIDTDIEFSDFFANDHTLMTWWMPQYPNAHEGPIFAENGGGVFSVGQYNSAAGDRKAPVFFIQVGGKRRMYPMPDAVAGQWMHIAVVRKANKFTLYVNAVERDPVTVYKVGDERLYKAASDFELTSKVGLPTGTLRIGRRTSGTADANHNWQAYGVVDDVAVFVDALTPYEISTIANRKRLVGWEKDLLAGLSFEAPVSKAKPLPQTLAGSYQRHEVYSVPVSKDRNSAHDAGTLSNPLIIGRVAQSVQLPFKKGETWIVVQGQDDLSPNSSHYGASSFCYDFVVDNGHSVKNSQSNDYPNGTDFAPVYSVTAGPVVSYKTGFPIPPPPAVQREPYIVKVEVGPDEFVTYRHLDDPSLTSKASGGASSDGKLYVVPNANQQTLNLGEYVALLGPNAAHLHFGASNRNVGGGYTIPIAFDDYEASDDGGDTWHHVFRGHPKKGQYIRRKTGT